MSVWGTRVYLKAMLVLVLALLCGGCGGQAPHLEGREGVPETFDAAAALEQGQHYTRWFYQGKADLLHGCCSTRMKQGFQVERLLAIQSKVADKLGRELVVLDERLDERMAASTGERLHVRTVQFAKSEDVFQLWWTLGADLDVEWFHIGPEIVPVDQEYTDRETKADLRLPFSGAWRVLWGGHEAEDNRHVADPGARFGVDFVLAKRGQLHRGDGSRNKHYYCFGQPVLAPGDGTVIEAIDGVPDSVLGIENYGRQLGNHVTLYHGQGEYSVLAHLKEGSVLVAPQQRVQAAQPLGQCGNSGASAFPHLHFHLQNRLSDAHGLPAQFQDYVADGEPVRRGEPTRGQRVQQQ